MSYLTQAEQTFLVQYAAPGERALIKKVPIQELSTVRGLFKRLNRPVRIRYRGPRHDGMRLTTLKADATAFSVYPK